MIKKKEINEAKPAHGREKSSVGYFKHEYNTKSRKAEAVKKVGVLSMKGCERKMGRKEEKPMKRGRRQPLKKRKAPQVDWYPVLDTIPELCSFK